MHRSWINEKNTIEIEAGVMKEDGLIKRNNVYIYAGLMEGNGNTV